MNELIEYQLDKDILCIDLKSFYASVECAILGLDPFTTPLVVADRSRGNGGLCLAVTPFLKELGVPSRCRIYELEKITKTKIIFAKPQMRTYMEYSVKVLEIYLKYVSYDDLYAYSIDEAFLDLTPYRKLYNKKPEVIAKEILDDIYKTLNLYAVAGVGKNMLMAKLAMDIDAKHQPSMIAKWDYNSIQTRLWPLSPLSKMWGIGHRMEHHLNQLGLFEIGDIAKYPRKKLNKMFGILGDELWFHSNGIDMSILQDKNILRKSSKSVGQSQVLFQDYYLPEILIILREMTDEVTRRLRLSKKQTKTVRLSIGYSSKVGGGFSRQLTLKFPTASPSIIFENLNILFNRFYENEPIRTIGISLTGLVDNNLYQYSIFEDYEQIERELKLANTVDDIKEKFGKNSLNRGSALDEKSTIRLRNTYVGGHHE